MRVSLILILLFIFNICKSQKSIKWNLEDCMVDINKWVSQNTMNDTLYNLDFFPNPELCSKDCFVYKSAETHKLDFYADFINVDTTHQTIFISGCINGGWYGGYSSEIIIMTAKRNDTISLISHRPMNPEIDKMFDKMAFPPPDTVEIVKFKNIEYWYTDYLDKDTCRQVNCKLKYNLESDILFFGQSNSYAELFDLKKIIKKYSH